MAKPRDHARLCVGIITLGDLDGAWLTIQAIRLYHPEVVDRVSFLVIDDDPGGADAARDR